MREIAERLSAGVAILEEVQQMRRATGDPTWGHDTEYAVLIAELWDLEEEILQDPGALKYELVRVPRGYTSQ